MINASILASDAPTNEQHYFYDTPEKCKNIYTQDLNFANFCCRCHKYIPDEEKNLSTCTFFGYKIADVFVFTPYIPLMIG